MLRDRFYKNFKQCMAAKVALLPLVSICSIGVNAAQADLMPVPAQVSWSEGKFRLDDAFVIGISGHSDARLYPAASRALRRLSQRTGLFFSQDFLLPENAAIKKANMQIKVKRAGKVAFEEDESYQLRVSIPAITLKAKTDLGALRGLETLLQLLSVDSQGYFFPAVNINDKPRFPWRGLMIDAARHWMPVDVIKRNLDAMAAVKLNVFHWHLSEDQGFRVESKLYPKLHEKGSDGFYYSQAQIKDVVAYADARGIRVVPEFDVPGHATSWLVGYPELGAAPGPFTVERKWGIFYPVLNPASEFTYEFLNNFFGEMAALFPDEFFHIGGDEVEHARPEGDPRADHLADHWNNNESVQAFMRENKIADNSAFQAYFNTRVLKILTGHGKTMVGWDEILHEDMPTNSVIQSWRGRESMAKAAKKGYRSLLSNGYYIDLNQATDSHYANDPLPADIDLSAAEKQKILGGEATMWSEHVTFETIDSRIWPRTAAIAERLWSPRSVDDPKDMYRRLNTISLQLEEHGLTHKKNYPMLLRRLAQRDDIEPLKNLVDLIEPVKGYKRNALRAQNSFSPYTRVVDAARPDAPLARNFRNLVDEYLRLPAAASSQVTEIEHWLTVWRDNHNKLGVIINDAPVLREIESLSQSLSAIAVIGLQAIELRRTGKTPAADWVQASRQILTTAKVPTSHQTELMVVSAIEKLVEVTVTPN